MSILKYFRACILTVIILVSFTLPIKAHPNKDHQEIQEAVNVFFRSLLTKDPKTVESKFTNSFAKLDRKYYLTTIMNSEVDR